MKIPTPAYRSLRITLEAEMMQHRSYHYPSLPNHKVLTLTAYRINALIIRTLLENENKPAIVQARIAATLITCISSDYATKILTGQASMEEHGKLEDYVRNKAPHLYALIALCTAYFDKVHAISRTQDTESIPLLLASVNERIVHITTLTLLTHAGETPAHIARTVTRNLTGYHIEENA